MSLNMYSEFKSEAEKEVAYKTDIQKSQTVFAQKADGSNVPLKDVPVSSVDRIGDLWRVQTPFTKPIRNVRGKDFVIGPKIDFADHLGFDYYDAYMVKENCYGKFINIPSNNSNDAYVVAECVYNGVLYDGYGSNIQNARAHCGLKLLDLGFLHGASIQSIQSQRQK